MRDCPIAATGARPCTPTRDIDLCLLPDFLVIDACHLEPTMDNLLSGIDFTVNAILYDHRKKTLVEKAFTAAVGIV